MSNPAESFFGAPDFKRGRYGWAEISQPDGATQLYRRASSMGGYLDDKQGLIDWTAAMVAFGMAKDPALLANFSVLDWKADKSKVKEMIAKAKDLGGGSTAADMGTAFHTVVEKHLMGTPIPTDQLPPGFDKALQAFLTFLDQWDLKVAGTEVRVVDDKHQIAGTTDLILQATRAIETPFGNLTAGQGFIADLKTGTVADYSGLSMGMQLGVYSHSKVYDVTAGERLPWPVNMAQWVGLIIKVDLAEGTVTPWWLDLNAAYENIEWAFKIQEVRKGGRKLIKQAEPIYADGGPTPTGQEDEVTFEQPEAEVPAAEEAKPAEDPWAELDEAQVEDEAPAKTEAELITEATEDLRNVGEARELYLKWRRQGASADNLKIIANRAAQLGATMKG